MQRFWGRWAKWALPLAWGAAFAVPVSATAEDGAEAPTVVEEEDALPPVQPPVIQVDEVSVTAARAERAVLDQPGNITVLTREDIVDSGVNTVPELLRRQVGVFVSSQSGSADDVNVEVRGFTSGAGNGSRTLVLVDGRRANTPQSGIADWGLVRIDDVERIEIVRGPASAVYGDAAIGGVIEIFTRRSDRKLQLDVTGRGGSYGMGQGSLFAGGSTGDFSGSVFVDGLTTDGYRERSDFTTGTAKGNLRYTLGDRLVIDFEGGYAKEKRDYAGDLTEQQIADLGRKAANPNRVAWSKVETGFAQGVLEWRLLEDVAFKLQPTWTQRKRKYRDAWDGLPWTGDSTTSTITVNGQFEIDRSWGFVGNRLVVGGEWLLELDKRGPLGAQPGGNQRRNRRNVGSFYVQEEWEPWQGVFLSGGVRYDNAHYREKDRDEPATSRDHYEQWSPKAALTWRPWEPFSVYFSYNRGIRFPNFDEIYPVLQGFAVADLVPERSTSYEVGAKFRNRQVQAGLAFYSMDVDDEILFDPSSGGVFGENRNIDRVRHRGVEASVNYQPWTWLAVYANFTYDDTKIVEYAADPLAVGKRVPLVPEFRGTVGADFFVPLRWFDVSEIGVNANIVGPRYMVNDLRNVGPDLPTYGTVDVHGRIGKKILGQFDLTLFFQIQNIGNEKYSQYAIQRPVYYPSPGRNFDVGLTVSFER